MRDRINHKVDYFFKRRRLALRGESDIHRDTPSGINKNLWVIIREDSAISAHNIQYLSYPQLSTIKPMKS